MSNNQRKPKVLRVEGNITYYECDVPEGKVKRIVSLETRKKLSEKRKSAKKQPREGQSKKAQTFYIQLEKDYIKQTSAMGKFHRGKGKDDYESEMLKELLQDENYEEMLEHEEDLRQKAEEDKDGFKRFIKISSEDKKEIKKWMDKNKNKLSKMNLESSGIMNEYDISKVNFSQIKMTDNLLENIDSSDNINNILEFNLDTNIVSDTLSSNHSISSFVNISLKDLQNDKIKRKLLIYSLDLYDDKLISLGFNQKKVDYYCDIYSQLVEPTLNEFLSNQDDELIFNLEDLINALHLIVLAYSEDKYDCKVINSFLHETFKVSQMRLPTAKNLLSVMEQIV